MISNTHSCTRPITQYGLQGKLNGSSLAKTRQILDLAKKRKYKIKPTI
jgi:hypothetical protein